MIEQSMHINWYPGHMKKTKELLESSLSLVDMVVEVVDARIPFASKNPDIDVIAGSKQRVIILNKEDLADPRMTQKWISYYEGKGYIAISLCANSGIGLDKLMSVINKAYEPKKKQLEAKGMIARPPRIMIVGVPNSGKSSLLNKLTGKKSANTGDRPGVTKGKQWVRLKGNLEMLDTPGILWPKFEDEHVAMMLAYTGAIKDDVLSLEEIGYQLLNYVKEYDYSQINKRYNIEFTDKDDTLEIMNEIAYERKFFLRKKEIDYLRTARTILQEYRAGMLGRITLEAPGEAEARAEKLAEKIAKKLAEQNKNED